MQPDIWYGGWPEPVTFLLQHFRECKLLNGILTNAEVWYPIKDTQIEVLEDIDLMFLRKLTKGHTKPAKEAFQMETGILPIRFVCMKRRVMYLHVFYKT